MRKLALGALVAALTAAGCGSSHTTTTVTATRTVTAPSTTPSSTPTASPAQSGEAPYTDPHGVTCVRSHVFPNGYCSPAYQLTDSSGQLCSSQVISSSGHCPHIPSSPSAPSNSTTVDSHGVECAKSLVDPSTGLCVKP